MPRYRSAYILHLAAAALASISIEPARAAGPGEVDVLASMQCDRANEPGRVRCTVEARAQGSRTISWADVEILSLPDFASALKGRIGPADALSRDAAEMKWALGLVAKRSGQGEVRARVRVVTCEVRAATSTSAPRCEPSIVQVKASLSVGG